MDRIVFDLQLFKDIKNTTRNSLVSGTAGNDSIVNGEHLGDAFNSTINAGAGNDTVRNASNCVSISAGAGDDSISNSGYGVTINAGAGNDTVYDSNSGNLIQTAGDLTVSIASYGDTIQTAKALKSSVKSGNNMLFTTADSHTVKILDAASKDVSVVDGKIFIDKAVDTVNVSGEYWNDEKKRVIVGSDGYDYIYNDGNNVTIQAGAGYDDIEIDPWAKNVTITDLCDEDTLVWWGADRMPRFASFDAKTHVLNLGNIKINLPNVSNADSIRDVGVRCEGFAWLTLGELLDVPAPYWKVSSNTATYYDGNGKVLATLTGLKSGLKVVNGEIAGIDINANDEITLSKSVLGTGTVALSGHGYSLALADDVAIASVDSLGWEKISDETAICQIKATRTGYYVGAQGKKIKYIKEGTVSTVATISGLAKGVNVNDNNSFIYGAAYIYEGEFCGGVVAYDASEFSSDNISVDGEDISFCFSGDNGSYENKTITGGVGNDHIWLEKDSAVITTGKGDDFVQVFGQNNKIITGEGNDGVYIAERWVWNDADCDVTENTGNTVDTGAGDDILTGTAVVSALIMTGAGDDTVGINTASNSTISTGDGDDLVTGISSDSGVVGSTIYGSGTAVTNSMINTGDGKDTIFVQGRYEYEYDEEFGEYMSGGTPSDSVTIDSGAGDDFIVSQAVISNSSIISGEGNDSIEVHECLWTEESILTNDKNSIDSGAGNDVVILHEITNSFVSTGAGNDTVYVENDFDLECDDAANRLIYKGETNSTINTGLGDDIVEGLVINKTFISTGAGNDTVIARSFDDEFDEEDEFSYHTEGSCDYNTINAGLGSDKITVQGEHNLIQYTVGDGNDTVWGL